MRSEARERGSISSDDSADRYDSTRLSGRVRVTLERLTSFIWKPLVTLPADWLLAKPSGPLEPHRSREVSSHPYRRRKLMNFR